MDFELRPAVPEDDADLRRLLAESFVPGRISVSFEREPNYFAGCGVHGRDVSVHIARERRTGALAAMACRATRQMYVNGRPELVGYLGELRVARRFEGRWILPAAFRLFRDLDGGLPVRGWLTTITEENVVSRRLLADRPRPSLPVYRELARLRTLALAVRRGGPAPVAAGDVRSGRELGLPLILEALSRLSPMRQFAPVWSAEDFADASTTTRGVRPDDFSAIVRDGRIVAVAGLWDQSGFRQTVVRAYTGWLNALRPLLNAWSWTSGRPGLPSPGGRLHIGCAAFLASEPGAPESIRPLLAALLRRAAERSLGWLTVAFDEGDPALPLAAAFPHVRYDSRVYLVSFRGAPDPRTDLDGRPLGIDVATL